MIELEGIKVEKIKEAIKLLTGIEPKESITPDRYCLSLGHDEPMGIGWDKRRKELEEKDMSYSAHVRMLREVAIMMQSEYEFIVWCYKNKPDEAQ